MQLSHHGAELVPAAFSPADLAALEQCLAAAPEVRGGLRLRPIPSLEGPLDPASRIAATLLGSSCRPVRAVLFDKSPERNWALGWHQDRTIAVRERRHAPGFADWTVKSGIPHVVPPFEILSRMLTLRIHFDRVGSDNAPLLVVPGSHRLGRIPEPSIPAVVTNLGAAACPAEPGDLWLYATPILHASQAAARPSRRRVLQILYSADDLPLGLEWLGV